MGAQAAEDRAPASFAAALSRVDQCVQVWSLVSRLPGRLDLLRHQDVHEVHQWLLDLLDLQGLEQMPVILGLDVCLGWLLDPEHAALPSKLGLVLGLREVVSGWLPGSRDALPDCHWVQARVGLLGVREAVLLHLQLPELLAIRSTSDPAHHDLQGRRLPGELISLFI